MYVYLGFPFFQSSHDIVKIWHKYKIIISGILANKFFLMIDFWSCLQLPPALVLAVVPQPVQAKEQWALELTAEQSQPSHGSRHSHDEYYSFVIAL